MHTHEFHDFFRFFFALQLLVKTSSQRSETKHLCPDGHIFFLVGCFSPYLDDTGFNRWDCRPMGYFSFLC